MSEEAAGWLLLDQASIADIIFGSALFPVSQSLIQTGLEPSEQIFDKWRIYEWLSLGVA